MAPHELLAAARRGDVAAVTHLLDQGVDVNTRNPEDQDAALHLAAFDGRTGVVELLLRRGAAPDHVNANGDTALHLAIEAGHAETVNALLNGGVDFDRGDVNDSSPVMLAALHGHLAIVNLLVACAEDVIHHANTYGSTALTFAAENNHGPVVDRLLALGAKVDHQLASGTTALMLAAERGHVDIVEKLLDHKPPLDVVNNSGRTALLYGVIKGELDIVGWLLDDGADVNLVPRAGEDSALTLAVRHGHQHIVKELLDKQAEVNYALADGHTALTLAAELGHWQIVEELLKAHANANHANAKGETPLILAAAAGHLSVLGKLLEHKAQPPALDVKDHEGNAALHVAAIKGHAGIVGKLLRAGADMEIQDVNESTPLMLAAANGHIGVVQHFLAVGAKLEHANYFGSTALTFAAEYGHVTIVAMLLDSGLDVNHALRGGSTALMLAADYGLPDVVDVLLDAGAKVNHVAVDDGQTALHRAASGGYVSIFCRLLEEGADASIVDKEGRTPVLLAETNGHTDVAPALREFEGSAAAFHRSVKFGDLERVRRGMYMHLDARGAHERTAVMLAAKHSQSEILKLLVARGAKLDPQDRDGWTVLHFAAQRGDVDVVKYLVTQGADREVADEQGRSPLAIAALHDNAEVEAYLWSASKSAAVGSLPPGSQGDVNEIMNAMSAKIDKLHDSVRVAASEQGNRRDYPGLWTLEYLTPNTSLPITRGQRLVLSIRSEISGLCFHEPIVLDAPSRLLAEHGMKLKVGLALFSCIPGVGESAEPVASFVDGQVDAASKVTDLVASLKLAPSSAYHTESGRALSPDGTMALFLDLLKLVDPDIKRLKIADLCQLQCALDKSTNRAVWAHRDEILARSDVLAFRHDYQQAQNPEPTLTVGVVGPLLKLTGLRAQGFPNAVWRQAYCEWELLEVDSYDAPMLSGQTGYNLDPTSNPRWEAQSFMLSGITPGTLLGCRLRVTVKRPNLLGNRLLGQGETPLYPFIQSGTGMPFDCAPVTIAITGVGHGSSLTCQIIG